MKTYSVVEASKKLGISTRAVQKRCFKAKIRKKSNRYLITEEHIKTWYAEITSNEPTNEPNELKRTGTQDGTQYEAVLGKPKVPFQTTGKSVIHESPGEESDEEKLKRAIELITIAAAKQNVQHKIFTEEEYIDLIGTLDRVEYQQEQIQYLRNRIEKQDIALNNLFKSIEQRNFIEAKQKGYDKED
jgi:hypothetical protein